jgi:bla regulator protein blaR1
MQTIVLLILLAAQTFEVASVKPSNSNDPRTLIQVLAGGGLRTSGATLRFLVTQAYQVRAFQILDGPGWIGTDRFDIIATVDRSKPGPDEPADPTKLTAAQLSTMQDQMRPRLAALLAERFGLKVHREMREQPIYELIAGKGGPKVEAVSGNFKGLHIARNQFEGEGATMDMLSTALANQVERPVVDRTGLAGSFNFKLNWASLDAATTSDESGPSIFTAVREQLGLELRAAKGPAEVLIIDHVERPTAN